MENLFSKILKANLFQFFLFKNINLNFVKKNEILNLSFRIFKNHQNLKRLLKFLSIFSKSKIIIYI